MRPKPQIQGARIWSAPLNPFPPKRQGCRITRWLCRKTASASRWEFMRRLICSNAQHMRCAHIQVECLKPAYQLLFAAEIFCEAMSAAVNCWSPALIHLSLVKHDSTRIRIKNIFAIYAHPKLFSLDQTKILTSSLSGLLLELLASRFNPPHRDQCLNAHFNRLSWLDREWK